jgi:hypothetical protein
MKCTAPSGKVTGEFTLIHSLYESYIPSRRMFIRLPIVVSHKSVQEIWLRHQAIFLTPCPKMLNVAQKRLSAGVIVI